MLGRVAVLCCAVAPLCWFTACATPSTSPPLADADRAAIAALDSAYVAAWLADDTAAVLATLAPDAVLMPAGQRPLVDRAAIQAFWWATDGSRTRLLTFQSEIDAIDGSVERAIVRGRSTMSFRYEKDGVVNELTSRVMSLTVVAPDAAGSWRITHRMWGPEAP